MRKILVTLFIFSFCFTTSYGQKKKEFSEIYNWKGGAIRMPGIYYYKDKNLRLKVSIENKLLKYQMVDSTGKELLRNGKLAASVLHKWAFYLDDKKNLWCLSSDLGHSEWRFDSVQNRYSLIKLYYNLKRKDVPVSLYQDLQEFFD